MKILIINPNSDPRMTRDIARAAERFAAGISKARRYGPRA